MQMEQNASYWINKLNLLPHREGGFYRETFKSNDFKVHTNQPYASSLIYFLLNSHQFSAFHRLKSDEVWLYHKGCAVTIYIINTDGKLQTKKLGLDIANNEAPQVIVPANSWFAAELVNPKLYCLMSCVVSPGFIWDDFELGNKNELISEFPNFKAVINKFTLS